MTMIRYLRICRMNAAKQKLKDTDETVQRISYACGFEDYPHFCKTFTAEVGLTPSAYRVWARKSDGE